jgi:hypothetical protein
MKKLIEALKRIFSGWDLNDLFMVAGAGVLFYGTWLIYRPAAFILLGLGLLWWGIKGSRIKSGSKK